MPAKLPHHLEQGPRAPATTAFICSRKAPVYRCRKRKKKGKEKKKKKKKGRRKKNTCSLSP